MATVRGLYPALTGLVLSAGLPVTTAVAQAAPTSPGTARGPHVLAPAVSAARPAPAPFGCAPARRTGRHLDEARRCAPGRRGSRHRPSLIARQMHEDPR